jgi:hypothetical protein
VIEPDAYCREVEAYLCRKNDGHLIRISGPAFDLVCGWARKGVPLTVVFTGIDRTFERYYRKGPRRRPVHVGFCEGDVLDAFDQWRRATGVTTSGAPLDDGPAGGEDSAGQQTRGPSLAGHIERVLARLTALRGSRTEAALRDRVALAVPELDGMLGDARAARGERRATLLARLREIDRALLSAGWDVLDEAAQAAIADEAARDLEPFRARMPATAFAAARQAAIQQLVRRHVGLPVVTFD